MRASRHMRVALIALLLTAGGGRAFAQLDILTGQPLAGAPGAVGLGGPESVITVSAQFSLSSERQGTLSVSAVIAPPWHAYSTTQKPIESTPTVITVDPSLDYQLTGGFRPTLPPAIMVKDGKTFETHSEDVTWQAPLELRAGVQPKDLKITGKARIQACNDQSCLAPTSFAFAALYAPPATPAASAAKGVYAHPNVHATLRGELEPHTVAPGSLVKLIISAEPTKGWHVYEFASRDPGDLGYKPTLIALTNTGGFRAKPAVASEKATEVPAEAAGAPAQRYHGGRVTWTTEIVIPPETKPGQFTIEGLVGYQTCSGNQCDPPRGARFTGTLVVAAKSGTEAEPLTFADAKYGEAAQAAARQTLQQADAGPKPAVVESPNYSSLPVVILASLLGGFVLNFMPCVLPVIGLKILSFAEQAGRKRGQILALNLWYSAGIISVFFVLAALASGASLGLRETNLGWGEQFGSVSFNVVMVAIVFVMALSFLGVWEIPIPGFVGSGKAAEVATHDGALGAFVKGVLTTVLATPCSGPMIGPVLGYTLNETPAVTFTIFGCIGLGMASPYLLIGAFPRLIRFLPKPGAWMDTFKQMMGFCMLGTIVFFFSFMNRDYLVPTFAMMVGLWAGCWWVGRTSLVEPLARKAKAWAQGAAFAAVIGWGAFTWLVPHDSIIPWKNFSQSELARLTGEGHTVLVDFTANWCANCKLNLFWAIETEDVSRKLAANKVVPLLADWSDTSPEIKEMLTSLGSDSIPLLAVYPPNRPPIVLHGIVTKQQVLDALETAGPSKPGRGALTAAR